MGGERTMTVYVFLIGLSMGLVIGSVLMAVAATMQDDGIPKPLVYKVPSTLR
jgi:hypothetical protein